jgi:hypothetical protein
MSLQKVRAVMEVGRPLVLAAAISLTAGAAVAGAQTVIVRQGPAGSAVEVFVNSTQVGAGTVAASGDVIVPLKLPAPVGRTDMDARVHVDVCDKVHRVQIVERTALVPAVDAGCERKDIPGLFSVRRITTLVINVGGPTPTLLLIQGKYSLDPKKVWSPWPAGLVVSGAGTFTRVADTPARACGDVTGCSEDGSGFGYAGSATFWFNRLFAVEAAYIKPADATGSGSGDNFTFDSALDAHIFTFTGQIAAPIEKVRLYGHGGMNYHDAVFETSETLGGISHDLQLKTTGWSWNFGGGMEAWIRPSVALYAGFDFINLKGKASGSNEGRLDDKLTVIQVGARVRLWK